MSARDDGGPAFPPQVFRDGDGLLQEAGAYGFPRGISLRDYFAGLALQGLLASLDHETEPSEVYAHVGEISRLAYTLADAMLKERKS